MNRRILSALSLGVCAATACAQPTQLQFYLWSDDSEWLYIDPQGHRVPNYAAYSPMYCPQAHAYALEQPTWTSPEVPSQTEASGRAAAHAAQGVIQRYATNNVLYSGHFALFMLRGQYAASRATLRQSQAMLQEL